MSNKYYYEHKEEISAKRKAYRALHKEEINAKKKLEYQKHKEAYLQRAKKRYELKKEEITQYKRDWNKNKYKESVNTLDIVMYQFEKDVTIVSNKSVKYKGITYHIKRNGYLGGGTNKLLHIEIAKNMGIWFEGCEVHHKDGNCKNNLESNLECLTKEQHIEAHRKLKQK